MTNTDQVVNAAECVGWFANGNRVWGPDGTAEIEGNRLEDLLAACRKIISKDTNTQFEGVPILDEFNRLGGVEGDVALFECRKSDSDISF